MYSGTSGGGTFAAAGEALETYDFDKFERFLEYAEDDGYDDEADEENPDEKADELFTTELKVRRPPQNSSRFRT